MGRGVWVGRGATYCMCCMGVKENSAKRGGWVDK